MGPIRVCSAASPLACSSRAIKSGVGWPGAGIRALAAECSRGVRRGLPSPTPTPTCSGASRACASPLHTLIDAKRSWAARLQTPHLLRFPPLPPPPNLHAAVHQNTPPVDFRSRANSQMNSASPPHRPIPTSRSTRPPRAAVVNSACAAPSKRTRAATARAANLGVPSPAAAPSFGCTVLGLVLAVTATRAIHVEVDAVQLGVTVHTDDPPLHRINPLYVGCHSDSGFTHQRGRRADVRGAAQPRAGERGALL